EATGLVFDGLVGEDEADSEELPVEERALMQRLTDIGIEEPVPFAARIVRWRDGSLRPLRSAPAREALEELLPDLMCQIARAPAPLTALNKLDSVIEGLPSAVNLLRLLVARPA